MLLPQPMLWAMYWRALHEPDSHDMRLMRVREALQRDGQPPEVRWAVEVHALGKSIQRVVCRE